MSEQPAQFSWTPYAAFLASALFFCASTALAKVLIPQMGVACVAAWRMGGAAVALSLFWKPWRTAFSVRDLGLVLAYGLSLGAMNFSFYSSIRTVPIGLAMTIQFTGPLAVAALSSRRATDFLWLGLAAAGLVMLLPAAPADARIDPAGAAWACAGAVFWASYMIVGKATSHLPAGPTVALGMFAATALLAPYGVIDAGQRQWPMWALALIPVIAATSALAYSLEMAAMRGLSRRTLGVLINLEPALGAAAGLVIFGQVLAPLQWAAMAAIMCASIGSIASARAAAPAPRSTG